jgi:hypothetical protein
MATDKLVIKELEKELKRLRLNNLRIKLHMQVLVSNPASKTSDDIRTRYQGKGMFEESILHYN